MGEEQAGWSPDVTRTILHLTAGDTGLIAGACFGALLGVDFCRFGRLVQGRLQFRRERGDFRNRRHDWGFPRFSFFLCSASMQKNYNIYMRRGESQNQYLYHEGPGSVILTLGMVHAKKISKQ